MVDFASTDDQWSTEDETNYADLDNYDPTATGDEYEPTAEWGHPDPVDDENPTVEVNDEQGHDEDDSTVTGEESAGEEGGGQDDPTTFSDPAPYSGDTTVGEEKEPVEPLYANVVEFVEEFFTQVIRRKMGMGAGDGGNVWDPRWMLYPEVAGRLKALWHAYEEARASDNASAMSNWWIHHLEPHVRVIFDGDTGPMSHAKEDGSWMGHPALPYEPVPRELLAALLGEHPED